MPKALAPKPKAIMQFTIGDMAFLVYENEVIGPLWTDAELREAFDALYVLRNEPAN